MRSVCLIIGWRAEGAFESGSAFDWFTGVVAECVEYSSGAPRLIFEEYRHSATQCVVSKVRLAGRRLGSIESVEEGCDINEFRPMFHEVEVQDLLPVQGAGRGCCACVR